MNLQSTAGSKAIKESKRKQLSITFKKGFIKRWKRGQAVNAGVKQQKVRKHEHLGVNEKDASTGRH